MGWGDLSLLMLVWCMQRQKLVRVPRTSDKGSRMLIALADLGLGVGVVRFVRQNIALLHDPYSSTPGQ